MPLAPCAHKKYTHSCLGLFTRGPATLLCVGGRSLCVRRETSCWLLFPQANNLTAEVFARFIYTDFLKAPLIVSPAERKQTAVGRVGGWRRSWSFVRAFYLRAPSVRSELNLNRSPQRASKFLADLFVVRGTHCSRPRQFVIDCKEEIICSLPLNFWATRRREWNIISSPANQTLVREQKLHHVEIWPRRQLV